MLVTQGKCAENTFITKQSTRTAKDVVDLQMFYQNSWNFTTYCTQLILRDVSILKSTSLPVAGSFTANLWFQNVVIYTAGTK
jgi:hypothetical protein